MPRQQFHFAMDKGLCAERDRKRGILEAAVGSPSQQSGILFIAKKGRCVVKMDETLPIASPTSLALLCNKLEDALVSQNNLCKVDVAAPRVEACVLAEVGLLHVVRNVRRSSHKQSHLLLPLERRRIVYDTLDEMDE